MILKQGFGCALNYSSMQINSKKSPKTEKTGKVLFLGIAMPKFI